MMLTISSRQRFWILSLAMVGAVSVAVSVNVFVMQKIKHDWEILNTSRSQFEISERERENLGTASRSLNELSSERSLILATIADPADPLPMIEAIEDLGRRMGVKVTLALSGTELPQRYSLDVEGLFPDAFLFLRHLESLPFLIELGDVDISRLGALVFGGKPEEAPSSGKVHLTTSFRGIKP